MSDAASKKVLVYEIVGAVFIVFLGSALHFTYELSGKLVFVGAFSAVNESVWEHLKLAFWPSLIWMLIEYVPLKKQTNNFLIASNSLHPQFL
jgi:ethanolamine utilization microcompartment shell protein EutS